MKCPSCGKSKPAPAGHRRYKCNRCGTLFDDDLLEGGDYDDRHPDARLIREEKEAREKRRNGRPS